MPGFFWSLVLFPFHWSVNLLAGLNSFPMTTITPIEQLMLINILLSSKQTFNYSLEYIARYINTSIDSNIKDLLIERYFQQNNLLAEINQNLLYHANTRKKELEQQNERTNH